MKAEPVNQKNREDQKDQGQNGQNDQNDRRDRNNHNDQKLVDKCDADLETSASSPPPTSTQMDADTALAAAQAKIAELEDLFLRAKAETENVRRRAQEDVEKAHKFAVEHFAQHLLPVLDSLEAALADKSNDIAKVREGIELTLRQFNAALDKGRIAVIHPIVGEPFDPHRHQAISTVPAEQTPNTVVTILQKGYLIADRVLRPALVTVCQAK